MTHDELSIELNSRLQVALYNGDIPAIHALRAVVELHKPTDDGLGCSYEFIECHDETGLGCDIPRTCNQYKPYPCPTIQAIEKELA
jgi:hypothetical protein